MDTHNWKWFYLSQLFFPERGTRLTIPDREIGNIPLITAGCGNEGVASYISNPEQKRFSNAITIDMFGFSCYRGYTFCCDDNILVLKNSQLNAFTGIFIATIINKDDYKCAYGRQYRKKTFLNHKILLPCKSNCEPDWRWMENYVKNILISKLPKKAKSVWQNKCDISSISPNKISFNTDNWIWFDLHKWFTVERGARLTIPDREDGNIPLITAGCGNHGVACYISNQEQKRFNNAITIDMFGFSCYRGYTFCCDDNILVLKNSHINNYSGIFIATIINKDDYKCAYGRQYRLKTFENHKILLPATPSGEPDWQFMEDYIKSMPYSKCI